MQQPSSRRPQASLPPRLPRSPPPPLLHRPAQRACALPRDAAPLMASSAAAPAKLCATAARHAKTRTGAHIDPNAVACEQPQLPGLRRRQARSRQAADLLDGAPFSSCTEVLPSTTAPALLCLLLPSVGLLLVHACARPLPSFPCQPASHPKPAPKTPLTPADAPWPFSPPAQRALPCSPANPFDHLTSVTCTAGITAVRSHAQPGKQAATTGSRQRQHPWAGRPGQDPAHAGWPALGRCRSAAKAATESCYRRTAPS